MGSGVRWKEGQCKHLETPPAGPVVRRLAVAVEPQRRLEADVIAIGMARW